ncbi:MAG TPA: type II toxin-antitoxin system VapB family antitoxin [Pseudonocardiaceae bacterium]|jgi:Arc/MetJ family transcription regulator|nr:type II toxin-antitoxin system VapB family antitoxin [Pseudonocardiaceae bacterium]
MSRTVIDLDDALVEQAAALYGTSSKVATVNAALADAVNRAKRAAFVDWLASGGLPDLGDEQVMRGAWGNTAP